jgi:site-specific recombinase XerC
VNQQVNSPDTSDYRRTELTRAADHLAELHRAANALVAEQQRENSRLAWAQDWKAWEAFCGELGESTLEVSEDLLVLYAAWLAQQRGLAPSSVTRRVSGVLYGWRQAGLTYHKDIAKKAREIANGHERRLHQASQPVGRGKAPAMSVKDLTRICAALPDSLVGVRDRALLLVGFGLAARRSELSYLDVSDITEDVQGIHVHVRFTKKKPRHPGIPFGKDEDTCPARAWLAWRDASGISDGAAFRRVGRLDQVGERMSPRDVGDVVTRAAEAAKVKPHYTGHSLRSGLATAAREAGHDIVTIARQGGWAENSSSLYGYIQTVDKWKDNAMRGVL